MRRLQFERTVTLAAPPEEVWPLLANNDLLNREMDLPLPVFTFEPRPDGGTRARGEVRLGPFRLSYDEHPFDWVKPSHYSVRRVFTKGPVKLVEGRIVLEADGRGTKATTYVEVEPKPGAGTIAHAIATDSIKRFERVCRGFNDFLANREPTAYPKESSRPPADHDRLERVVRQLRQAGFGEGAVDSLAGFIRESPAAQTVLFRPTELGKRLHLSKRESLELCLGATVFGMLDLSWRVMCPFCGGNRRTFDHLSEITNSVHCESCAIRYDSGFDSNVEVLFSAAHSIRPVVRGAYCIGGPHLSPNVVAQVVLQPGEERRLELPGRSYVVRSRQAEGILRLEEPGEVVLSAHGFAFSGGDAWSIRNERDTDAVVRFEVVEARIDVVTAAEVTSLARFRDRFSAEVLSPGTELAVRQVCLMFTDLKESTRMYREQGDAPSYALVRQHFERLSAAIEKHNGAIVKTIGDAVMASFHDPADGIRAALAIQAAEKELVTKIGLHSGPAIAVNANGILDYFGRTVNLAARLQKHSVGGDVVTTRELAEDPTVAEVLADLQTEEFCADIRGVAEGVEMVRVWPG